MKRIDLSVETRETGKHNSRTLRSNRQVPAVVYGAVDKPINVCVLEKEIVKYNVRAYENALYTLKGSDKANNIVVLMKSVDVHPLTRRPQHVDFFALDLKKPVRINVEIRLEGKPVGLADGGLLNVVLRSVEVEVLPTDIPEFFTADVSNLGVGDALHVSALNVPKSVKILTGGEQTIAVVNEAEAEIVATPAPTAAAAAPAAAEPAKK